MRKLFTFAYLAALISPLRGLNVKTSLLDAASGTPAFFPGNKYVTLGDSGSGNEVVPELEAGRLVRLSDVWPAANKGFGLQYARATDGIAALAVIQENYSNAAGAGNYFTDSNQFDLVLSVALLSKGDPLLIEAGDAWAKGVQIYQGDDGVGVATPPASNAVAIGTSLEAAAPGQAAKVLPSVQDMNGAALAGSLTMTTLAEAVWDDETSFPIPAGQNLVGVFLGGALQALGTDYTIVAGEIVPTGGAWDSATATPLVLLSA